MKPVRVELAHRANYGVRRGKIEWIVMHYTANDGDSGMSNARYFQKALNPVASAHYFVDDREIVQSVPDEYVAYHCGAYKYRHPFCRNYNSIGIEMCDSKRDGTVKATEQTIRNAAELAAALCERYGLPVSHIIRHYDVTGRIYQNGKLIEETTDVTRYFEERDELCEDPGCGGGVGSGSRQSGERGGVTQKGVVNGSQYEGSRAPEWRAAVGGAELHRPVL